MGANRCFRAATGLILLSGLILSGCGYPQVSETTYRLSKSLYAACNLRSEERLSKVAEMIEATGRAGTISDRELCWLLAIVEQAREGHWDSAMTEAREILKDNVQH